MPTLEVQLAKAQKELDRLSKGKWEVNGRYWVEYGKRADQVHGDDAELRGLRERVSYLHQRLEARNARAAPPEVDLALVRLAEYQSLALPTHTSEPTAPA